MVGKFCWNKDDRDQQKNCDWGEFASNIKTAISGIAKRKGRKNGQRRRLLGWKQDWEVFAEWAQHAESNTGKCRNSNILSEVRVNDNGAFEFSCSASPDLCDCITEATENGDQYFTVENIRLGVFKNEGGTASYEICEGNECGAYGDVNEGDLEGALKRRRRLFQAGGGGGS